jgi:hypothetical protein
MQEMTHRFTVELQRLQRDSHDKCCLCGSPFQHGDTAYAGYTADGGPLYVGICCESRLSETAARFYWQERPYDIPEADASLWRYVSFAKFVALLKDKALYFARADHLGDRFEGAKGVLMNKIVWDDHYLRFFMDSIRNPPPGHECTLSSEEVKQEAERLLMELAAAGERDLHSTYVSCWHESEAESEALWRLYCPPSSGGVAIRTTFAALNTSLGNDPGIAIGRVRYVDFRKGFAGPNDAIFRKRQSLSHEKEVRAVIRDHEDSDTMGLTRPVDLNCLFKQVVISPFADQWFEAVLKETMRRFGFSPETIAVSDLTLEPFF